MLSHPVPEKNHVNLMHWLYGKSCISVIKGHCFLQPMTSKNDGSLCKLDISVKNRTVLLVVSASLNLSRNFYFIASSTLKIKCDKSKDMQEKIPIMGVCCFVVDRKICHLGSLFSITSGANQ